MFRHNKHGGTLARFKLHSTAGLHGQVVSYVFMMDSYYIGVDVGTSSVRAGLVSSNGRLIDYCSRPLQIWHYGSDYYEQSSKEIWTNVCEVVKSISDKIKDKKTVHGMGFDATCSLVALNSNGDGVPVNKFQDPNRNIIMWLDHRAIKQAELINNTGHEVLRYVGGALSPEMQAAKLLWLRENLPRVCWNETSVFLDLPEYLTYKATDQLTRSMCSLVCKFNYMGHETQKPAGVKAAEPGEHLGQGLTKIAAEQMGLWEGCPVGCSLIDAHAGGVGVIGADASGSGLPCENQPITNRLALVCGTSTCHMAISEKPMFVKGVWGPYYSAMVPGLWLNEGGQSATGKLIDHLVENHPAYREVQEFAKTKGTSTYEELNRVVIHLSNQKGLMNPAFLAQHFHVFPDFHGNRSPIADPNLKGMICGLSLTCDIENLAVLYVATMQALAHGTRHIVQSMNASGHDINTLFLCGGLSKNSLFVQTHADITGMPCVLPRESESILLGAAILGACASGHYGTIQEAMKKMTAIGDIYLPDDRFKSFHDKKYKVYHQMLKNQDEYRQIMDDQK
ncbi:FGGY carbohydrate kinase domain-containing protein-like isoform X2 [Actinia tenebrosa]|uniref:FGGY carbohydrate kinase domain-containing protein-like isoform X2 n=1 Tax=Actinia tenebrosa TaxID=6105 RepID=A0A6P8HPA4_ACTTE|nr:FGGY carbohydrate kinase domain-containing protein-like isoform X2 [Actinia tenebrosa]